MKHTLQFIATLFLLTSSVYAQVSLSSSPYTQDFNTLASGLPAGWSVRTGATTSTPGATSLFASGSASWASATGNFRNVASATGLLVTSTIADQAASVNRALAIRQTGTFGDPGAAIVFQLANTRGWTNFVLRLKLQSLDGTSTGRTTSWRIDYGLGAVPTSFVPVGTSYTTTLSSTGWGSQNIVVDFGGALDNYNDIVWIRVVTLSVATGSGSRPTSAIDDVSLTYSPADLIPPLFVQGFPAISQITNEGFIATVAQNEDGKAYYLVLPAGASIPSSQQVRNGMDANNIAVVPPRAGTLALSAFIESSTQIRALNDSTAYSMFVVAEDRNANLQAIPTAVNVSTHGRRKQAITLQAPDSTTWGKGPFFVVTTSSSGLPVTLSSSDTTVAIVKGDSIFIRRAGQFILKAQQPGDQNYQPASEVSHTMVVRKSNQTVLFEPVPEMTYGDVSVEAVAISTSGLPVTWSVSDTTIIRMVGSKVIILNAGKVTITALQPGNINYRSAVPVQQILVIAKKAQTITFSSLPAHTLGESEFTVQATASSGLAVEFRALTTTAVVRGNKISLRLAGVATIEATQPGNSNYLPADPVMISFCVNPSKPVITISTTDPLVPVLTSSAASNNQWFLADVPVSGATSSSLEVHNPGTYAVQNSVDGCISSLSNKVSVVITELDYSTEGIRLYPSPAMDVIRVDNIDSDPVKEIYVINELGQRQSVSTTQLIGKIEIRVADLAAGTYLLILRTASDLKRIRFVKQ